MSDLVKQSGSREIANNPDPIYLLNTKNGRIFMWTPILAVEKHMVDCDSHGNPIARDAVAGDNPYIIQETKRVADDMAKAGANPDTVSEYGQMLSERAYEKFKALQYEKQDIKKISNKSQIIIEDGDPFRSVYERIEEMASNAIGEIQLMTLTALRKQAGHDKPGRVKAANEVSYQWQIDAVMKEIRGC